MMQLLPLVFFSLFIAMPGFAQAQAQIVEAAKAEKELLVYATTQTPVMTRLIQVFNKKYPFLKVEYYRAGAEKVAQRFDTEHAAGRHIVDVVNLSGSEMYWTVKKGNFVPYDSPERKHFRASYKDKQGYWTAQYSTIAVIGYNRKLVPAQSVPKSYDDLLNPKWKGQIGLDMTDDDWYMLLVHVMGEKKALEFVRGLAKQDVQFRRGRQLAAELLAAGEWALAPTMRIAAGEEIRKKGAPVDWVAIEPLYPNPPNALALARRAPHPNAGKLWIDHILSKEVQDYYANEVGVSVGRTDVQLANERLRKLRYGEIDWPVYLEKLQHYQNEWRKTLNLY